jgi:hypothetical protein
MKRKVKQNIWGNYYGYEGRKRVKAFPTNTLDSEFQAWINGDNSIGFPAEITRIPKN